ncbi:MAG TPA: homoserine kinase [Vicinamibacteria bacterium]|nr:homoserine kinase [Vicinamibacteria bacterium]
MDRITVYAPGSSSNLGAGFDCLGLALEGCGDRVTASRSTHPGVRVVSASDPRIPLENNRNTAALAAMAVLRRAGEEFGIELEIQKGLPLAAGLGGSAASAVAGAVAAQALVQAQLSRDGLLAAALEAEAAVSGGRHADNVAPSLLGGAVLVASQEPLRLTSVRVHPSFSFVLVTPDYSVETATARRALPESVSRQDAVEQSAHLAGLVLGLERGDADLVRDCMTDRIAEPARAALFPGYLSAFAAGIDAGATGVAVSGAGPTLVAVVAGGAATPVARAMIDAFARSGHRATSRETRVDKAGARVAG